MTVKQLMKRLEACKPTDIVVIASDSEGNSYNRLYNMNEHEYSFDGGEIGLRALTETLKEQGYEQENIMRGGKPCVVLWP